VEKKQIQASEKEHNPRRALCDADHNSIGLVSTWPLPLRQRRLMRDGLLGLPAP
jgi:hypothetical protein